MEMFENVIDFEIEFERLFVMYSEWIYACFAISQKRLIKGKCLKVVLVNKVDDCLLNRSMQSR